MISGDPDTRVVTIFDNRGRVLVLPFLESPYTTSRVRLQRGRETDFSILSPVWVNVVPSLFSIIVTQVFGFLTIRAIYVMLSNTSHITYIYIT